MAVSDVYRVKCVFETREGEGSLNFHYQELTLASLALGTVALAEGLSDALTPALRACMATSAFVSRWVVDKLSGTTEPGSTFSEASGSRVGTFAPVAIPANSAILINLGQELFSSKSNGKVWLSGIPTTGTHGAVLDLTYRSGVLTTFRDALLANVAEVSAGDGLWRLVVLSRKFLLANPGDYAGASADVLSVTEDPRIATMRSRTFGGRRRKKTVPPPV